MIAQHFPVGKSQSRSRGSKTSKTRLEHLGSGLGLAYIFAQRRLSEAKSCGISLLQDVTGDADTCVGYAPRQVRMRGTVI